MTERLLTNTIKKLCNTWNVYKMKSLVRRENPLTQKFIAKSLNRLQDRAFVTTKNKIIRHDIQLKNAKNWIKKKQYSPSFADACSSTQGSCRFLYEIHYLVINGDKLHCDPYETYVSLNDCKKEWSIYYKKCGENNLKTWFWKWKKKFQQRLQWKKKS